MSTICGADLARPVILQQALTSTLANSGSGGTSKRLILLAWDRRVRLSEGPNGGRDITKTLTSSIPAGKTLKQTAGSGWFACR